MQVYTGTCEQLTPVACSYDNVAPAGPQARVHFIGTSGTTYRILVGGWYGVKFGNINILALEGAIANDSCTNALAMTEGVTYTTNTIAASSTNDPFPDYYQCRNSTTHDVLPLGQMSNVVRS